MPDSSFTAQVSSWVRDVEGVLEAIFRESSKRVIEDMLVPVGAGGSMPIRTGFLRASLLASTTAMPTLTRRNEGNVIVAFDAGPVTLAIAGADLGETIFAGFTAVYAAAVNYGRGYLFLEKAAQKWPAIVSQVEAELLQRAGLN